MSDTLSRRKPMILSFGQKTLGWPTILSSFAKMAGFDNPGYSRGAKSKSENVPLLTLF